ncbi:beta-lactamase family protein [Muricauda sp. NFXS6]|uniref:serine hydrolase domain-containing protein n=1 Tax=Allomuricauda sp. NFXS6 TaxID=2819094 RepID=UPI0032DE9679
MHRNKLLGYLAMFFLMIFNCFGQNELAVWESEVDSIGEQFMETPGFVYLVSKGDHIISKKAYGLANYELDVPLKVDYCFAIGSLSKQFIAISVLKLVEQGKLTLDAPIQSYLPWFNAKENITIESLLSHTSGIQEFFRNGDFLEVFALPTSRKKMIAYLSKEVVNDTKPGEKYNYSNAGYAYLTLLIEAVTQKEIGTYLDETIFKPLQMNSTYWGTPGIIKKGQVSGYNITRDEHKTLEKETYLFANITWALGAGAIYSTAADMNRWMTGLFSEKLISKNTLEMAIRPYELNDGSESNYGFGFEIGENERHKVITHSGMIDGFQSNMIYMPSKKIFGIGMSNRIDFAPRFIYGIKNLKL